MTFIYLALAVTFFLLHFLKEGELRRYFTVLTLVLIMAAFVHYQLDNCKRTVQLYKSSTTSQKTH